MAHKVEGGKKSSLKKVFLFASHRPISSAFSMSLYTCLYKHKYMLLCKGTGMTCQASELCFLPCAQNESVSKRCSGEP